MTRWPACRKGAGHANGASGWGDGERLARLMPVIAAIGLMGGWSAVIAMRVVLRAIAVFLPLDLTAQDAGLLRRQQRRVGFGRMGFVGFAKRGYAHLIGGRYHRIGTAILARTSGQPAEGGHRGRLARIIQSGAQGFRFDTPRAFCCLLAGGISASGSSGISRY